MATDLGPIVDDLIAGIIDNQVNDLQGVVDALFIGLILNDDSTAVEQLIGTGLRPTDRDLIQLLNESLLDPQRRNSMAMYLKGKDIILL